MKRVPWAVAISRPLQYDGGTTWIVIVTVMMVMMMVMTMVMMMVMIMVVMMVMMMVMMIMNMLGLVAFFHLDLKQERS